MASRISANPARARRTPAAPPPVPPGRGSPARPPRGRPSPARDSQGLARQVHHSKAARRKTWTNLGAGAIATLAHLALLAYLALNLKPFDMPPEDPPIEVSIVELPPLYEIPTPKMRGRLDAAEMSAPASATPAPPTPSPPVQTPTAPPRNPTPTPTPIPRPEVLTADVKQLAPEIPPEPQTPKPVSASLLPSLNPDFTPRLGEVVSTTQPLTAQTAPSATAAQRSNMPNSLNPFAAPQLRDAAGGPAEPGRAATAAGGVPGRAGQGGVDDRWRVRPDGGAGMDCPPIAPERMSAAQRARCLKPVTRPRITEEYAIKDPRFEAAARQKQMNRDYRNNVRTPYPGINCSIRGKCPPK